MRATESAARHGVGRAGASGEPACPPERDGPRAHEERFRSILHWSQLGKAIVDAHGYLLEVNPALAALAGVRADLLVGRPFQDLFHPEDREAMSEEVRRASDGADPRRAEHRLLRADGAVLLARVHLDGIRGDPPCGLVALNVEDVTAQRSAGRAIEEHEERLQLALEASGGGIIDVHVADGTAYLSPALAELAPAREHASLDQVVACVHPDDRARVRSKFERLFAGDVDQFESEHRVHTRRGELRWHHIRARIVERDAAGLAARVVGSVLDVTNTKQLTAQVLYSGRMASIGTMAAGVAHEINNPLACVVSNLGCALESLTARGEPADPEGREAATAIRDAQEGARRIASVVRGLEAFSRPPGAAGSLHPIDPGAAAHAAATLVRNHIRHRAALTIEVPELPRVMAEAGQIEQVLVNLLLNAGDAIAEGHAAENEVRIAGQEESGRVVFKISDTGRGIRPEQMDRVFEPFFTTKRIGEGMGLGLSAAHGIVSRLGGTISVLSEPAKGSTFVVALPAGPPERPRRPAADAVAPAKTAPQARVLVVDDDAAIGSTVARALRGHRVTVHTRSRDALAALLSGEDFDVVVCDLMMPDMTGMELYERVRAAREPMTERFLFLTGGAFTPGARDFLTRVPRPVMRKPFEVEALRTAIGDALTRRARREGAARADAGPDADGGGSR